MNKVAVLIPDWFWSSIPYEGLALHNYLNDNFADTDLLMFDKDIRLNKLFPERENEKYYFNRKYFKEAPNLRIMENWLDFFALTKDYKVVITSVHLAPKSRPPENSIPDSSFKTATHCPVLMTDIGGTDMLTVGRNRAHYFCVKGNLWKNWMMDLRVPKNNIFVTGTPHYDYYHAKNITPNDALPLPKDKFAKKYELHTKKKWLLIAPSNPASHQKQFEENLQHVKTVNDIAKKHDYQVLIKTYPHDYMFFENRGEYSGVHKRSYSRHRPHYDIVIRACPTAKVLDSQDHFAGLMHAHRLFNMSGSHLAWETYFTKCESYAMNYKNQPYYGGAAYLPGSVELPDDEVNLHIDNIDQLFTDTRKNSKKCENHISNDFSFPNIVTAIKKVINDQK